MEKKTSENQSRWVSLADRLNPNRDAFDPDFKEKWKSLNKKERKKIVEEDKRKIRELRQRAKPLPFPADPDDHCETSKTAYQHIVPFLRALAKKLKKTPEKLKIYDPYYCAGAMVRHLNELGFSCVHNQPDDFYHIISAKKIPPHDILITNPPYSGDHFDRLKNFLSINNKPHMLLVPAHFDVDSEKYAFLRPKGRYHYWTPRGMRPGEDSKKRKHRNLMLGSRNSPFPSQWCISLAPVMAKGELLSIEPVEGYCQLDNHGSFAKDGAQFRGSREEGTPPDKKVARERRNDTQTS